MTADMGGPITLQFPQKGSTGATDTDVATAGNINGVADKVFWKACINYWLIEAGCLIGTVTPADSLVFTVDVAPIIGGTYATVATVTRGATAIAAGTAIETITPAVASAATPAITRLNAFIHKGDIIRISVTDDVASGTGAFYIKLRPAGDPATHLMYSATTTAYTRPETISTTA